MEAPSLPRLSLVTSWCVVTRDIAHRPGRGACSSELGRAPEMARPLLLQTLQQGDWPSARVFPPGTQQAGGTPGLWRRSARP